MGPRGGRKGRRATVDRGGRGPLITDVRLRNGVRVLCEPLAGCRTASVGIWFQAGSRDDAPYGAGAAHLLEHVVFKGGRRHGARALAEAMDTLGGQFNAFTTREHTCFHARTIGSRLAEGLDLLAEMVVDPRCDAPEVERERSVVCDELAMLADDPGEIVDELFSAALWGGHPLGQPPAGTLESVRALDADTLLRFHRTHYVGERCVVAAAGRLQAEPFLAAAEAALGALPPGTAAQPRPAPEPHGLARARGRRSEQAHLVFGSPGPTLRSPDRWAAALYVSMLGGSPSSRLFQSLREERGLCYDVGVSDAEYEDAGEVAVFLATGPREAARAAELAIAEVRRLAEAGPTEQECRRHCDLLVAAVQMGMEGAEARMTRLGRHAVAGLPLLAVEQVVRRIQRVSPADVQATGRRLGDPSAWAAAFVGPPGGRPGPWRWEAAP